MKLLLPFALVTLVLATAVVSPKSIEDDGEVEREAVAEAVAEVEEEIVKVQYNKANCSSHLLTVLCLL